MSKTKWNAGQGVSDVQAVRIFPQFRRWCVEPRKPPLRRTAVGGRRAEDCAVPCRHGRRHPRALAMRGIAAASNGHGNGLRPARNNTEKPPDPLQDASTSPCAKFRESSVSRDAGFRVRRSLGTRRNGAESSFHARACRQEWKGDSAPIAASRFEATPVSVVDAAVPSLPEGPLTDPLQCRRKVQARKTKGKRSKNMICGSFLFTCGH